VYTIAATRESDLFSFYLVGFEFCYDTKVCQMVTGWDSGGRDEMDGVGALRHLWLDSLGEASNLVAGTSGLFGAVGASE
jgi:hypothetical protein